MRRRPGVQQENSQQRISSRRVWRVFGLEILNSAVYMARALVAAACLPEGGVASTRLVCASAQHL